MTRKDFELIADVIRRLTYDPYEGLERLEVASAFADRIKDTNPLFNREKFIERATKL